MTVIISGDNGVSDVDGSAGTPAIRGTDANTGIFFGADQVGVATNGVERVEFGNSETVFNDSGASVDFRVEGDTDANLLFVDASTDRVGIGTSTPSAKLTVSSGSVFASGANRGVFLGEDQCAILGDSATAGSANMLFYTANAERARITSGGVFLVGTTTAFRTGMSSFTTSAVNVLEAKTTSSSNPIVLELRGDNVTPSTSGFAIASAFGGGDKFYVYTNGNVVNVNNSYGSLSDIKLKENVTDATPKLAGLMQVRVVNYNLKSDPEHKQLGVVAQELEQVFPSMIHESPDRDEEGNILETTTKSVKYSVFVPMLIKAIQELKAINDAQASRIETLEAKVAALEAN